jgi:hypothetical protein
MRSIRVGERFQSGNYGSLLVYQEADLADRYRIVGLLVEGGGWAGIRVGIPEHELGSKFPVWEGSP